MPRRFALAPSLNRRVGPHKPRSAPFRVKSLGSGFMDSKKEVLRAEFDFKAYVLLRAWPLTATSGGFRDYI